MYTSSQVLQGVSVSAFMSTASQLIFIRTIQQLIHANINNNNNTVIDVKILTISNSSVSSSTPFMIAKNVITMSSASSVEISYMLSFILSIMNSQDAEPLAEQLITSLTAQMAAVAVGIYECVCAHECVCQYCSIF